MSFSVKSHFVMNPGAIETILLGPESTAQKRHQGNKIKNAWQNNIHTITGATERSIDVEAIGSEVNVVATSAGSNAENPSAWSYLEYGTSKMRAQHPGRRAIRGS